MEDIKMRAQREEQEIRDELQRSWRTSEDVGVGSSNPKTSTPVREHRRPERLYRFDHSRAIFRVQHYMVGELRDQHEGTAVRLAQRSGQATSRLRRVRRGVDVVGQPEEADPETF